MLPLLTINIRFHIIQDTAATANNYYLLSDLPHPLNSSHLTYKVL